MTQEEFIKELDNYYYEEVGDKIIVTYTRGVYLNSLETLPDGIEFSNGGNVSLASLRNIPKGVVFNNGGYVYLEKLIGGWSLEWVGNIDDIDSKRLLNKMIADGLFDRR
jgi:hypothetical protein